MSNQRNDLWKVDAGAVAAAITVGVGVYFLGIGPALAEREKIEGQRQTLAQRRAELDELKTARRETIKKLDELQLELDHEKVKPEHADRANARLAELTDLADKTGASIDQISPGKNVAGPRHGAMPIRISGRGSYAACSKFLSDVHEGYADMAVTGFKLSSAPGELESPIAFSVDLLWFTAPE